MPTTNTEHHETRSRATYHEAGHLVAVLFLGLQLDDVCIAPEPSRSGHWIGRTRADFSVRSSADLEKVATTLWAGSIAERSYVTRTFPPLIKVSELMPYGADWDGMQLRSKAAAAGLSCRSERHRRCAARIVRTCWTDVVRWAERLDVEGSLEVVWAGGYKMGNTHFPTLADALAGTNGLPAELWIALQQTGVLGLAPPPEC
jgi:hypothetical protein